MKLILLSGGSGKRLWPLSNDSRSKQFLRLLEHEGRRESMVQRVWRQIQEVDMAHNTIIATNSTQIEILRNQIDTKVPFIIEPERRDTFPAILLAVSYLYSVEHISQEEVVTVMPVDPFVETPFFHKIRSLEAVFQTSDVEIALLGVTPTYPSEKYGYIVPEPTFQGTEYMGVSRFIEKPSADKAKQLIGHKALWNCGVFSFKLKYLVDYMRNHQIPLQFDKLQDQYHSLNKISFDYAVVEKAERLAVLPYDGYWKDLGTWNTLLEEISETQYGKGKLSESENTHLINELDIPVTVLGIHNAIVAASPDGILVANKADSPRIKDLATYEQRPMYVERRWGHFVILDNQIDQETNGTLVRKVFIRQGENVSYHYHTKRKEIWTILQGNCEIIIDGSVRIAGQGDVIEILPFMKHSVKALTHLDILEVQTGQEVSEQDIHRICYSWKDIFDDVASQ